MKTTKMDPTPQTTHLEHQQERVWLCWSPRQNCFHIEDEARGLQSNQRAFSGNTRVDYVPIGVFPSREAASVAAAKLRAKLREREVRMQAGSRPELN